MTCLDCSGTGVLARIETCTGVEIKVDCPCAELAWMQTASGRQFWLLDPQVGDVDVNDIAHALSQICRFSGHTKQFYSVAQHSVLVSRICRAEDALWGLLHDASEAYLGDVIAPLKRQRAWDGYRILEDRVMGVICERFGLPRQMPASVHEADMVLLATEKRDVMQPDPASWGTLPPAMEQQIDVWHPHVAKGWFLNRFRELTS